MVQPVKQCNPAIKCCPDLGPAPVANPRLPQDAFIFSTKPIINPFARNAGTNEPIDWSNIALTDVQQAALNYHAQRADRDPAVQQDRAFARDLDLLTTQTASGEAYPLIEYAHLLPAAIRDRVAPELLENPDDLAFTWAWQGDRPQLIVYNRKADGHRVGVELNPDDSFSAFLQSNDALLWGGSAFLLGSVSATPSGGAPRGMRPGLPAGNMLLQGGIGAGMLLGIHVAVTKLGVPKQLAPYADVGVMVGVMEASNQVTGALAARGILFKGPLLPHGFWGSVAQSSPYFVAGSIGIASALDAFGCKFGSTCNTMGTITGTTIGYVGIGQTTHLLTQAAAGSAEFAAQYPRVMAFAEHYPRTTAAFARLGTAYEAAVGVGLEPATVNIGSRAVVLGSRGSGVFYAAGGPAGGAGWLSGGIQALGAFGAVALGSWIGGGIVDLWAWYSGNSSNQTFKLIDLTWHYMNQGAAKELGVVGKAANTIFGPVIRGMQALTISDLIWQGMTEHWQRWAGGCNDWTKGIDKVLLSLALASTTANSIDAKKPQLRINMHALQKGLKIFFTSTKKPADCSDKECMSNAKAVDQVFDMISLLEVSSQRYRLRANTRELYMNLSRKGAIGNKAAMRKYLHQLIRNAQENKIDDMWHLAKNMLTQARKQYASRMVQLKLMRKDGDKLVKVKIRPKDLNAAQKAFLFGGEASYYAFTQGQNPNFSSVQSEYIELRKRINALEYMLRTTKIMDQSKAPTIANQFSN